MLISQHDEQMKKSKKTQYDSDNFHFEDDSLDLRALAIIQNENQFSSVNKISIASAMECDNIVSSNHFVEGAGMLIPTWTFGGYPNLKFNVSFKTLFEGTTFDESQFIPNNDVKSSIYPNLLQISKDFTISN